MSVAEIAFLILLGSAYFAFLVVLAWTVHQTKAFAQGKPAGAQAKSETRASPTPSMPEKATPRMDRAA